MKKVLEYFGLIKSQKIIDMESDINFLKCSQLNNLVCAQLSGRVSDKMRSRIQSI